MVFETQNEQLKNNKEKKNIICFKIWKTSYIFIQWFFSRWSVYCNAFISSPITYNALFPDKQKCGWHHIIIPMKIFAVRDIYIYRYNEGKNPKGLHVKSMIIFIVNVNHYPIRRLNCLSYHKAKIKFIGFFWICLPPHWNPPGGKILPTKMTNLFKWKFLFFTNY